MEETEYEESSLNVEEERNEIECFSFSRCW